MTRYTHLHHSQPGFCGTKEKLRQFSLDPARVTCPACRPKRLRYRAGRRLGASERDRLTRVLQKSAGLFYESHRQGDDPPSVRLRALVSSQGTACTETCLCESCDSPRRRAKIDRESAIDLSPDAPVSGSWTDCSENDVLYCSVCGIDNSGHKEVQTSPLDSLIFPLLDEED